ncbi:MAG: methionine--tRNA ligase [Deltaproteobacteria bacterium]|nr:methionine--tRNA ligase [Deltaproteobacteria bacterium]
MSDGKFYITTPIYYVNFKPHIGTSYTTVLTDVASRVQRMLGDQALLVTGSDEHSQNIADLAEQAGKAPRAYCDEMIPKFRDCWKLLNIADYAFERTSDEKHHRLVQRFWQQIYQRGDVYKGEYAGWYHTTDNRYLDPEEVPDEPEKHPRLKHLTEEAYFFKLSAYTDWLLAFHEANPNFVVPDFRRNEMLSRITQGLNDTCISRTSTSWGIPLPWDEKHVFYVWVEALLTYMTGSGFDIDAYLKTIGADGRSSELREPIWETTRADLVSQPKSNFWPADLHVMAKDIPWFHAVIWPAMLASFGAPPPKQMLVHGYWKFRGAEGQEAVKMSKSLGNVVDPYDAAKLVGADGVRYFLMREVPVGRDGEFGFEAVIRRYNYDLANDLGNLVHRTISMLHQQFDGVVPERTTVDAELAQAQDKARQEVLPLYQQLRYSEALGEIWALVRLANQFVDRVKPWELKKKPERREEVGAAFNQLIEAIRTVVLLAYPVIPAAANRFWQILGLEGTLEQQRIEALTDGISAGHRVGISEVVFQRVDKKLLSALSAGRDDQPALAADNKPPVKAQPAADQAIPGVITIDDFGKVALRVAEIREASKLEKADKLLRLRVFDGERERQIIAGIAKWYAPQELTGQRVIIVANLKPAKLRGELSEGMLLAAEDGQGRLSVVTTAREVDIGSTVR